MVLGQVKIVLPVPVSRDHFNHRPLIKPEMNPFAKEKEIAQTRYLMIPFIPITNFAAIALRKVTACLSTWHA